MYSRRVSQGAVALWALAVATVFAVVGMHALMGPASVAGPTSHGPAHSAVDTAVAQGPQHGVTADAVQVSPAPSGNDDGGGHSSGHTLAHLCLAVLAGAITALLVALVLAALAPIRPWGLQRTAAVAGAGRAPPWTQLSLAQLSVLRV